MPNWFFRARLPRLIVKASRKMIPAPPSAIFLSAPHVVPVGFPASSALLPSMGWLTRRLGAILWPIFTGEPKMSMLFTLNLSSNPTPNLFPANFSDLHLPLLVDEFLTIGNVHGNVIPGIAFKQSASPVPLAFDQHFQLLPPKSAVKKSSLLLPQLPQTPAPVFDNRGRDLPREGCRPRALPSGKGEDMEVSDGQVFNQVHRIAESLLVFSGESADYIHADGQIRNSLNQPAY